ncbi:MAG: GTP cyclohydrolase II RibA [Hyphomicrobiales bacterium]|nr:GTP cyclohydrolase II RibA [Hyphomicrobiales bacterium]
MSFASLLGADAGALSVDRAISEFRAGRPVLIDARVLVAPAESLDEAALVALAGLTQGAARLVLAGPRLQRLGAARRDAGALALPRLEGARIARLALAPKAALDAPILPLQTGEAAALSLAHLAGLIPAVLTADLPADALRNAPLARVSTADIEAYPARRDAGLHIVSRAPVPLEGAQTQFVIFRGGEGLRDQVAVIVGEPDMTKPVPVRLHSACLTGDLFGSLKCDCGDQLRMTARRMAEENGGVILYLDQEGRGNGLASKIKAYSLQADGLDTYDADATLGFEDDHRNFAFAADMLKKLGVTRVNLITNNPRKVEALRAAGLDVVSQQRVHGRTTPHNEAYLSAKRDRAGHAFDADLAKKPKAGA